MALPSFFKRKKTEDAAPPAPAASARAGRRGAAKTMPESASARPGAPHESAAVMQARTHARRRLIGAAVLLLLGVLLFPLVFETQPRPLPLDLPMTVAPGNGAPTAVPAPAPVVGTVTRPAPPMIVETAEPEPRPALAAASAVAQASPAPAPQAAPPAQTAQTAQTAPPAQPARAVASAPAATAATAAAAVVTAKPAPAPATASAPLPVPEPGRFVVQVGAFADDATVRQTRQKVEKLGLKTYTQEVSTDAGKRVRVRVGPFATRDEATQVLNKLKGSGLPGAVLTL
jgi:DedD protein